MTEPIPEYDGTQQRIRQQRVVFHTDFGTVSVGNSQSTSISPTGDITTDEARHVITVDGQAIYDPTQIIGYCQNIECRQLLTVRTFGYCVLCFQVRCPGCSAFDDIIGNWLCTECYKAVKRQRLWQGIRNFLLRMIRIG